MARLKSKSAYKTPAHTDAAISARVENNLFLRKLTCDDFTNEYWAVVESTFYSKINKLIDNQVDFDDRFKHVIEQSIMRVVHVGQKQKLPPSKVSEMVMKSAEAAETYKKWIPQKNVERRAGMMVGSSRLRKIG